MEFPQELRYTEQHEWIRAEGDRVRVGITDFAQDALGDVVYVDVPEVGTEVKAGQAFGEVESTKSVSDVYAPVSGTVVERNGTLSDAPETVNDDPYGQGWMIVIEPTDRSELEALLDASAYQQFTERESGTEA
ncbi:MAG: glycine cleavage system protein GcvH [Actinobacteria bacterium]|nr:MAG: glycine cleavage system protein GcvH [Actinomycetota bacterium]